MTLFQQPLFINLPTSDVARIRDFWTALGAGIQEEYSDPNLCVCVQLTESSYAMYLLPEHFDRFTDGRPTADTHASVAVLNAVTVGTREQVDALADLAVQHGATEARIAADVVEMMEAGGMYTREIIDPDGHQWEFGTA
ncbi:MAG: lactoylglutathione lyase [Micrococcus sp.]|nr:lactoylglutathione lyase [Micrococcus sp.]